MGVQGDPDARPDGQRTSIDFEGGRQGLDHFFGDKRGVERGYEIRRDDNEFIAPVAPDGVFRTQELRQSARGQTEELIPNIVAQRVVYPLKVIEVDKHNGEKLPAAIRAADQLLHPDLYEGAIGEIGQGVVGGHMLHAPFDQLAAACIADRPDKPPATI